MSVDELNGTLQQMNQKLDGLAEIIQRHHPEPIASASRSDGFQFLVQNLGSSNPGPLRTPSAFGSSPHSQNPYPFGLDTDQIREDLSLTRRHLTAPQHILSWPCSPFHLSRDEMHYPLHGEINRASLPRSSASPPGVQISTNETNWVALLSWHKLKGLVQYYFNHFNPSCLILDEETFYQSALQQALRDDFSTGIESCLSLLVCALGAIVARHAGQDDWTQIDAETQADMTGLAFFNMAIDLFPTVEATDWTTVQCLLLMR